MVESLFLERFASLCIDPLFHVRKVCAANFGDFSTAVGLKPTEMVLLPKFFYLCEDGVWGVRKACADVFMPVSCVCSPEIRQTELSPLFINLLRDQSRWVRMAAFQALGPFISTFADASITSLLHNDDGEIVITDTEQLALRLEEVEAEREQEKANKKAKLVLPNPVPSVTSTPENSAEQGNTSMDESSDDESSDKASSRFIVSPSQELSTDEQRAKSYLDKVNQQGDGETSPASSTTSNNEDFSSFLYWREPLPSVDLPEQDPEEDETVISVDVKAKSEEQSEASSSSGMYFISQFQYCYATHSINHISTHRVLIFALGSQYVRHYTKFRLHPRF